MSPSHGTFPPYSNEEAAQIKRLAAADEPLVCPRCGEQLSEGSPLKWRRTTVRLVHCASCRRELVLRDG